MTPETEAFAVETEPRPDDVQYLEDRIYEHNSRATGIAGGEWLAILVRDGDGRIAAGIAGSTWGGGMEIRQLWVEEARRDQGLGSRLLAAAEREAMRRGCDQAFLSTFSFQAPRFYARRGYEVIAEMSDYPRGHRNLVMRKRLVAPGGEAREKPR